MASKSHLKFHVNLLPTAATSIFPITWEEAAAKLQLLPRMIFEPDGSFVVSGDDDGRRWQVDGHLFDFAGQLQRVELHGQCPPANFDALLQCVGWPAQQFAFELVREGNTLNEYEFRQFAANVE